MSLTIQQSSEFSPANVQFSKLRKNKNGGKAVYLNAGDNKKLYLQFPFCLLYTSPSPRDRTRSRMPSSA